MFSFSMSFDTTRTSPGDFGVGRVVDEIADLWWHQLAVAVDPAVALFEGDQRPRQIEVDQVVALLVEIDALRRDVRRDQHPDRRRCHREVLDDLLLFLVALGVVEGLNLLLVHTELVPDGFGDPVERADPFGEDHDPFVGFRSNANVCEATA